MLTALQQIDDLLSLLEEEQKTNKVSVSEILWRGAQPSWQLTSNKLRLVLTKNGLNIASVSLLDDDTNTNPFWVPKWPWNDPLQLQHGHITGEMEKLYGNTPESQLAANICGHNMCCDRFGPCKPSDDPQRPCHGEAPINLFRLCESKETNRITFQTTLSGAKLNIMRAFAFHDATNTVEVSTTLMDSGVSESGKTTRSDVEWCEHVTLGDPFLNGAVLTANADNAYNFGEPLPKSRFKQYPLAARLPSVEECLSLPKMGDTSIEIEEVTCLRVQDNAQHLGTFNARNDALGFELIYKWDNAVFPWLAVWSEHYGRHHAPWNAKERCRGLEFSTKPFPIPELETHKVVKEGIYEQNGKRMFEERTIDFELGPQGRTEVFSFQWKRIADTL